MRIHNLNPFSTNLIWSNFYIPGEKFFPVIFNNPFIIWGKYKKQWFHYKLSLSFQFHHTQMDGAHAGKFLANLQNEINNLNKTQNMAK